MENLLKKGIQIEENNVTIEVGQEKAVAYGNIITIEKIGELKPVPENEQETQGGNTQ